MPACGTGCTASCSTSCPPLGCRLVAGQHRRGVGARQKGGELTGPNPTDRGKPGSKYHLLCDANGPPLHVLPSAANTHDSLLFEPLLDTNPAVRGERGRSGRPRRRLRSCTPTRAMTTSGAAPTCTAAASPFETPAAASRTRPSSAGTAGSSNAPSPGYCASSASACATTEPNAPCDPYSPSPPP